MDPMLGMIFMVPWNWAPNNYQLCQGQTINLQQYEALFSLTGTVFGGNGSTNFMLPNLQGRAPVGTGQATSGSYFTLAASGGAEQTTLSASNLVAHTHGATFTSGGGGGGSVTATGAVTLPVTGTSSSSAVSGTISPAALSSQTTGGSNLPSATAKTVGRASGTSTNFYPPSASDVAVPTTFSLNADAGTISGTASGNVTLSVSGGSGSGTVSIAPAGSSVPFSNMPPFLAMSFVIAMNGLYPDRP